MSPTYTDPEGNEVEIDATPEEINALMEASDKLEGLEASLKEKEDELGKLQNKDMNFSNFRKKTKEEQEEMTKDWDNDKKVLLSQITGLHERIDNRDDATLGVAKEGAIKRLAGEDKDLSEKLGKEFERLGGDNVLTADDVNRIYDEASALVKHKAEKVNPINAYQPGTSGPGLPPTQKTENYADTDDGKKLAASLSLEIEEPKKDDK